MNNTLRCAVLTSLLLVSCRLLAASPMAGVRAPTMPATRQPIGSIPAGGAMMRGAAKNTAIIPSDYEQLARDVVSELAASQFDRVEAQFDQAMRHAVPQEKLRQVWASIIANAGSFQKVTAVETQELQGYHVVVLTCAFQRGAVDVRLAFDSTSQIGGLFFTPAKTTAVWQPPPYARPSSFQEQSVTVKFESWELPGTLTVPRSAGLFPAVVLVQGSGPHDEDETIGPNKPFKDLAWGLGSRGVAVLRYVKRTKKYGAQSSKDPKALMVADETVNDARAAVALLVKQKNVDAQRIYVLGHSLGGMLAPRIATGDPQIAGLIILAGSTRPIEQLIVEQTRYLVGTQKGQDAAQGAAGQKQIAAAEHAARDIESPGLKPGATVDMMGIPTPASYWLDLRTYHPAEAAAKLPIPMLILQGERDYQVRAADFAGWRDALAGRRNVTFKSYPELNHLFQAGTGPSTPQEYETPGHVSEDVVQDIAKWILALRGGAK